MSLKVSVSGVRGIWRESLTLQILEKYIYAYAKFILVNGGKKILLGRDARVTGEVIATYTSALLASTGLDVVDAGIVPTPTVLFGVRNDNFDGGIIITASHNPENWNALKLVNQKGSFLSEEELERLLSYLELKTSAIHLADYDKLGTINKSDKWLLEHLKAVEENIDLDLIRSKHFRVFLDPINGAGSVIGEMLLKDLGCEVEMVNSEQTGIFAHVAEPNPENLKGNGSKVRQANCDIAFAMDPDADRLVIIDENGKVLSEEWTTALVLKALYERGERGDIVINLATSSIHEDIATSYGGRTYRSKVGEANVVEALERYHAFYGAEGNGGVIYPNINAARDTLVGIALILEFMARENYQKATKLVPLVEGYIIKKEKFSFEGDLKELFEKVRETYPQARTSFQDGMRLDWNEGDTPIWILVRASNTEPVIRIIGESKNEELLDNTIKKCASLI